MYDSSKEGDNVAMMKIRSYGQDDRSEVVQLWRDCGLAMPHNDPVKDIHRKLSVQSELFLVGVAQGQIIATIMAGYEGHRGWLNYLAVAPNVRRSGLGRQMVLEAEKRLYALGCPKVNLQVRTSNREALHFYKKIGYGEDNVISLGKRLVVDDVSG